ncbi:hypothetical protein REMIM1_PC00096 (plasmid) [Rhizobium etli bv. mimosae str. Mim1]|nr:hypothetical protein REMIM1_PC00096 [Rhizobium etli bv. mimosae str. Mim1]
MKRKCINQNVCCKHCGAGISVAGPTGSEGIKLPHRAMHVGNCEPAFGDRGSPISLEAKDKDQS